MAGPSDNDGTYVGGAPSNPGDSSTSQPDEDTTQEFEERILGSIGESGALEKPQVPGISEIPYNPAQFTDGARRSIAYWLLSLLTLLLLSAMGIFVGLFFTSKPPTFEDLKNLVAFILTPLITLVSAATGFYFGSHNK